MAQGRCSLFRATRAVFCRAWLPLQVSDTAAAQAHETASSEAHAAHHERQAVLGSTVSHSPDWITLRSVGVVVHVVIPPPRSWSAPPRCSSSCERRCFSPLRSASQGPDGRVQRPETEAWLDGAATGPRRGARSTSVALSLTRLGEALARGRAERYSAYTCTRGTRPVDFLRVVFLLLGRAFSFLSKAERKSQEKSSKKFVC